MAGTPQHAGLAAEQALVMTPSFVSTRPQGMTPLGGLSMWLASLSAALVTFAAAIAPGWSGVMTLAWLGLALVTHRSPTIGLALLAFTIPLQDRYLLPTIAGDSSITGYTAWAFVAGAAFLREWRRPAIDRAAVALAIVVATLIASWASGEARLATWYDEVYHWFLPLLVYLAARVPVFTWRDGLNILAGLAIGVVVSSWEAIEQAISGSGPASFEVAGLVRVFGPFSHPNTLASYLVIALPMLLSVGMVRSVRSNWLTLLAVRAGAIVGVASLLLTQSRGGWIAFAFAVIMMLALAPRSIQRTAAMGATGLVLIVVGAGLVGSMPGLGRFATIPAAESVQVQVTTATWGQMEREAHWGAAISMVRENPVFGVGAGEFNDSYREHTPVWRFRVGRGHAHNGYLHFGAQAGVPGLAAFTIWVGTMLVVLAQRLATRRRSSHVFVGGALASVSAFAVHSIFEYIEARSLPVLLVLVVAVALNVDDGERAGNQSQTGPAHAGQPS